MNITKKLMVFMFIVFLIIPGAFASNLSFLSHSALSFFTRDDWQLSNSARDKALNNGKDGQKISWFNPATGSHGTIYPYHTTTNVKGDVCRHLKMLNSAHLIQEKSIFRYCKQHDVWRIM